MNISGVGAQIGEQPGTRPRCRAVRHEELPPRGLFPPPRNRHSAQRRSMSSPKRSSARPTRWFSAQTRNRIRRWPPSTTSCSSIGIICRTTNLIERVSATSVQDGATVRRSLPSTIATLTASKPLAATDLRPCPRLKVYQLPKIIAGVDIVKRTEVIYVPDNDAA